jgi:hypothetical protein
MPAAFAARPNAWIPRRRGHQGCAEARKRDIPATPGAQHLGHRLHEAGKRLLEQVRLLVAQIDSASHVIADCKGELTGRLSVVATPWLAMTLLPPVEWVS